MFLTGQVQGVVGLLIAICKGVIDDDILDCIFDEVSLDCTLYSCILSSCVYPFTKSISTFLLGISNIGTCTCGAILWNNF